MSLRASLIFKVVISEQEVRLSKAMQLREQNLSSCSWQHNSPEGARFCHVDFCWCPLQSTMQNLSLFSSIAKAHLKYSLWHKYSKSPALLMLLQLFAPEQIPNVADLIFFPFSRWCKQASWIRASVPGPATNLSVPSSLSTCSPSQVPVLKALQICSSHLQACMQQVKQSQKHGIYQRSEKITDFTFHFTLQLAQRYHRSETKYSISLSISQFTFLTAEVFFGLQFSVVKGIPSSPPIAYISSPELQEIYYAPSTIHLLS